MNELISVIVPVYNVEDYLCQCLDSILRQSYKNLQIILVDDGSTDQSGKICDEYGKKDKRIEIIHKANGGLSDARNVGLASATGKFIAFVDSDDYIADTLYETLLGKIRLSNAPIAMCGFWAVDEGGKKIPERSSSDFKEGRYTKQEVFERLSFDDGWNLVVVWNKLYSRKVLERLWFPTGKLHEDQYIFCDLISACDSIYITPKKFYCYRQRKNSIMAGIYDMRRLDEVEAILYQCEHLKGVVGKDVFCRMEKKAFYLLQKGLDEIADPRGVARINALIIAYKRVITGFFSLKLYSIEEAACRYAVRLGYGYYKSHAEKIQRGKGILYKIVWIQRIWEKWIYEKLIRRN